MTPTAGGRPSTLRLVGAFLAIYLLWGSTYLAIRFGVQSLPPFLMAATRHTIPGLVLFAWRRARGVPAPTPAEWRGALLVGLLLLLGGNGLVTWAEQWVPSGLTALLIATVPLFMGLLGGMVEPASRPRARGIAGVALGFAGVALLVEPNGELAASRPVLLGALGILAGSVLWACGSLASRRANLPKDPFLATSVQMLGGAIGCFAVGTLGGEWSHLDPGAVSARSALSLLYLVVFGSIVAFSAYVWLLQVAPPAKVATYAYVNPVVAVYLGWALGGETVSSRTLLASVVIIGSVVMITTERKRAS